MGDSQAVSPLAHLQLLMLPTSAVPALAVPVVSLVDSPADSHKVLHQLLMLLTLAVPASAPQDKAHQPQKQKLPQLTSLTNPRSPDEQESKFGKHDTPVHAFKTSSLFVFSTVNRFYLGTGGFL